MVKCVVSGCPNRIDNKGAFTNRPSKRFFNFPKDQARVKVWLAALRESEKEDLTEQHIICEDHFLTDHITPRGISEDAIPIMPPYLDGPLGLISPWGAESSDDGEEEVCPDDADAAGLHWDEDFEKEDLELQSGTETESSVFKKEGTTQSNNPGQRKDLSLGTLTKRFVEVLHSSPDGVVDLNEVAPRLRVRKRRVYDVTNVLEGIHLIRKQSTNKIKWIGHCPAILKQRLQHELGNLKIVEETLDELIKSCAHQLFDMTDDMENSKSAYVTHEDISHLKVFQDQTVIAIKAPEETKLEVPTPKEDSIQIHLKGGRGPMKVLTSEMDRPGDTEGTRGEAAVGFITLEESRIKTMPLSTGVLGPQTAVQSA
ncbi:uncharacterized protein e2f6 [Osmerus eperlanus]|uniref:uncharacterized protein e2f6 n=1 Tax=Osmerus eperlanus TaxID=29151 RepID=UPI002E12E267